MAVRPSSLHKRTVRQKTCTSGASRRNISGTSCRFCSRCGPGLIGELADQAHKLAEQLGDDHDLAVLRGKALENDGAFPNAAARSALIKLIDGCRTELREKAFVLGRRIYVEKPKAFEARFGQYWEDWQSQPGP